MKKIGEVEKFYIDKNKNTMTPDAMAKVIGCTSRTIYNYLNKSGARTAEERELIKNPDDPAPVTVETKTEANQDKLPPPGLQLVAIKRHGDAGVTMMTKSQSEIGDVIAKRGPKKGLPDYIKPANPSRET